MKTLVKVVSVSVVLAFVIGMFGTPEAAAKTTLTWWHLWGGTRAELIDKLVADYKATHPDVEFEVTFAPPNEMQNKIVQAAGTGTLPDIFTINTSWYINLEPAQTLLTLDEYLKKDNIVLEDILLGAEAKRCYYEGAAYSLPNVTAGGHSLFFYNTGLMKRQAWIRSRIFLKTGKSLPR